MLYNPDISGDLKPRFASTSEEELPERIESYARTHSLSVREKDVVAAQLEDRCDNVMAVIKRCNSGFPMVLLVNPFHLGEVFPTFLWMSCPLLKEEVFRLEDSGLLASLTKRESSSQDFSRAMKRAHRIYARCRRRIIDDEQWERAGEISPDIVEVLKNSGVGGIRTAGGLKCLHAHLADYLILGRNPAGREAAKNIEPPGMCRNCYHLSE